MTIADFLERVVADGIAAARADYLDDQPKRDGSVAGFEACRGKTPPQLVAILQEARLDTQRAFREQADDYWYWRCRELEIEWVCNVLSAALANSGIPAIVPPTYRGVAKAADILGVAE